MTTVSHPEDLQSSNWQCHISGSGFVLKSSIIARVAEWIF